MGFGRAFALVTGVVLLSPAALVRWVFLSARWNQVHLPTRVLAEERSDDNAVLATVTAVFHPGWWMTPSCDAYSVRVETFPDYHPVPHGALDLSLPFDNDEVCEGPVSVQWTGRRRLVVTVVTDTLQGTVTRKLRELVIQTNYQPRSNGAATAAR